MSISDWKKIAAFGAVLIVIGIINEELALTFGVAALLVLLLRNPDAVLHPFGK